MRDKAMADGILAKRDEDINGMVTEFLCCSWANVFKMYFVATKDKVDELVL